MDDLRFCHRVVVIKGLNRIPEVVFRIVVLRDICLHFSAHIPFTDNSFIEINRVKLILVILEIWTITEIEN